MTERDPVAECCRGVQMVYAYSKLRDENSKRNEF
jgi:hypothetical protein